MYVVLHFLKPTITNAIVLLLADISWGNIRKIIIKTRSTRTLEGDAFCDDSLHVLRKDVAK